MRVEFSAAALEDLTDIAAFIARDNPTRAGSFVDELEETAQRLGDQPHSGAARPEYGDGIRLLPYRRYLILYSPRDRFVLIERILHGARDITTLLGE